MKEKYRFFDNIVTVIDNNVYDENNNWIGNFYEDEWGKKHVLGPHNKGYLAEINS